jgi:hypothetical protein
MHRLLRTRVLVPCGVALFVLSGCFGSTPYAVLPCAVPDGVPGVMEQKTSILYK